MTGRGSRDYTNIESVRVKPLRADTRAVASNYSDCSGTSRFQDESRLFYSVPGRGMA